MTNGTDSAAPSPPPSHPDTAMDDIEEEAGNAAEISPDAVRKLANAHFAQGDYDTALPLYSLAIDGCRDLLLLAQRQGADTTDTSSSAPVGGLSGNDGAEEGDGAEPPAEPPSPLVVHLCNRSACLYRMERYDEALIDAAEAVQLAAISEEEDADAGGHSSTSSGSADESRDGHHHHHHHAKASFRLAKTQIQLRLGEDAVRTAKDALERLDRLEENIRKNAGEGNSIASGGKSTGDGDTDTDGQPTLTTDEDEEVARGNTLEGQRKELERLLRHAEKVALAGQRKSKKRGDDGTSNSTDASQQPPPQDLTVEPRTPSIREFTLDAEIGQGNFSRVVICTHKVTTQRFALKIIEKKKVEQLAKRQHPNVYNEVKMERRVLEDRLPPPFDGACDGTTNDDPRRRHIVTLYHSFQDYNNLYFLQELHDANGDLWSALRAQNKMVGTYPSLARRYAWELLDAIEYLHAKGIVHRDLKPENCLLDKNGHLVVLDFGTSKDMVWRDLNGPEFVGTADFMAPEMVKGVGDDVVAKAKAEGRNMEGGVDHSADLWAYGAVLFQLLVGSTPFAAPSPYLTFLRIQRGALLRPWGVAEDDAWDLIQSLMKVNPRERFGADGFDFTDAEEEAPEEDSTAREERWMAARAIDSKSYGVGYDVIRQHPYFDPIRDEMAGRTASPEEHAVGHQRPIPSLRDLALRVTAELIVKDSLDFDVEDNHPPGDGSSHDLLRLSPIDRKTIMHFLDRTNVLAQPRLFRRFFKKKQEAKLGRVRPETRDYVGLSRLNDGQGNFPSKEAEEDPNHPTDFTKTGPIQIVYLWNPLFDKATNVNCSEDERKEYISMLKDKLRLINKTRPKLVVASGYFDKSCLKLMGKINESIPVAINDGSCFYSTWTCGAQGLFLRSSDFLATKEWKRSAQMLWLKEILEQSKLTQHHVFVFVDCDPKLLPEALLQRLHRGKSLCIFGPNGEKDAFYESKYEWQPENGGAVVDTRRINEEGNGDDNDANSEASSTGNDPEHEMLLVGSGKSQLRILTLEEYGEYKIEDV